MERTQFILRTYNTQDVTHTMGQVGANILSPNPSTMHTVARA
jgi:hypothetical protein